MITVSTISFSHNRLLIICSFLFATFINKTQFISKNIALPCKSLGIPVMDYLECILTIFSNFRTVSTTIVVNMARERSKVRFCIEKNLFKFYYFLTIFLKLINHSSIISWNESKKYRLFIEKCCRKIWFFQVYPNFCRVVCVNFFYLYKFFLCKIVFLMSFLWSIFSFMLYHLPFFYFNHSFNLQTICNWKIQFVWVLYGFVNVVITDEIFSHDICWRH